jgi:hypothetical protein
MRYMLLIYADESRYANVTEAEQEADMQAWFAYDAAIKESASSAGDALQPVATATSVREENGRPLVTDGPFAETKEQLGGYYLLDVADLDEAISWAQKCPGVKYGTIEVRPIMEFPEG